jgi:hypothetical protein
VLPVYATCFRGKGALRENLHLLRKFSRPLARRLLSRSLLPVRVPNYDGRRSKVGCSCWF